MAIDPTWWWRPAPWRPGSSWREGRATGVEYGRRRKDRRRVRASSARSSSAAGAIGSPRLLMLSGIGRGDGSEGARHRRRPRPAGGRAEPAGPPRRIRGERVPRRLQLRQGQARPHRTLVGPHAVPPVSAGTDRVHPDRCRGVLVRRPGSALARHPAPLRARLGAGARPRQARECRRHPQLVLHPAPLAGHGHAPGLQSAHAPS